MTITKKMNAYMQQLVESGLYGRDVEEAIERLIAERLQQLLKDGLLESVSTAEMDRRKCPACGSPSLNDISSMGGPEFQCLDCGRNFKP